MSNEAREGKAVANAAAEEAKKAGDTLRKETQQLADEAGKAGHEEAERQFERGQSVAASQVETLSSAVGDAARTLTEQDHPLGRYTRELADSMSGLSDRISNSSLDELASDTRRVARENPALFLLGGIAVGFAASRFFKASASREQAHETDGEYGEQAAYGAPVAAGSTTPGSASAPAVHQDRQSPRSAAGTTASPTPGGISGVATGRSSRAVAEAEAEES